MLASPTPRSLTLSLSEDPPVCQSFRPTSAKCSTEGSNSARASTPTRPSPLEPPFRDTSLPLEEREEDRTSASPLTSSSSTSPPSPSVSSSRAASCPPLSSATPPSPARRPGPTPPSTTGRLRSTSSFTRERGPTSTETTSLVRSSSRASKRPGPESPRSMSPSALMPMASSSSLLRTRSLGLRPTLRSRLRPEGSPRRRSTR
mmetsp:Transcript_2194/g.4490  ORF Transcript_2194/g.4490 Transcript_2194/m.4490 type:complete len:203 (-) Transcript_2194:311-919(-)